jgi:sulfur-oxidizing protein SoxZ
MPLGRVNVPASVRKGEAFEVRVLVQHPMETGFRREMDGKAIPMNVVNSLVCRYNGAEVFSAELGSGVAANPYLSFFVVADAGGEVVVEWSDDKGEHGRVAATLVVA